MERAISTLTNLPVTKFQVDLFAEHVIDDILSGYIQPEQAALLLKSLAEIVKKITENKEVKEYIQNACDLHTEKTFSYYGAQFCKKSRSNYDFKMCEDPEWLRLSMEEMQVSGMRKTREEWLKKLKEPTPDPLTGEIILPPGVSTTEFITIKLDDK